MEAVVYNGPRDVSVSNVPDPKIKRPTDVIVKMTSTKICGSDLHMYEGRTDMEAGRIFSAASTSSALSVATARVNLPTNVASDPLANPHWHEA